MIYLNANGKPILSESEKEFLLYIENGLQGTKDHKLNILDLNAYASVYRMDFVKLVMCSEVIDKFCKGPLAEQEIWLPIFNSYAKEDSSLQLYLPFSHRDFLIGKYFFELTLSEPCSYEEKMLCWQKSAEYNFYGAIHSLLFAEYVKQLHAAKTLEQGNALLPKILSLIANAKQHWTPGFILCYATYFELGDFFNDERYFSQALTSIIVAEKLLENAESIKAISTCYRGAGLEHIYPKDTFDELKKNASQHMDAKSINHAYQEADKILFTMQRLSISRQEIAASEMFPNPLASKPFKLDAGFVFPESQLNRTVFPQKLADVPPSETSKIGDLSEFDGSMSSMQ